MDLTEKITFIALRELLLGSKLENTLNRTIDLTDESSFGSKFELDSIIEGGHNKFRLEFDKIIEENDLKFKTAFSIFKNFLDKTLNSTDNWVRKYPRSKDLLHYIYRRHKEFLDNMTLQYFPELLESNKIVSEDEEVDSAEFDEFGRNSKLIEKYLVLKELGIIDLLISRSKECNPSSGNPNESKLGRLLNYLLLENDRPNSTTLGKYISRYGYKDKVASSVPSDITSAKVNDVLSKFNLKK